MWEGVRALDVIAGAFLLGAVALILLAVLDAPSWLIIAGTAAAVVVGAVYGRLLFSSFRRSAGGKG